MGFPHRVHHPPAIRIERGLNGCVPHEFLLHREGLSIVAEPCPVRMPQGMPADRSQTRSNGGWAQLVVLHVPGRVGLFSGHEGRGEHEIGVCGKIGLPLPLKNHLC